MIELVNVSKYYPTDFGRHYVFRDVSLVLPIDKSVGVLGPNGAGKSTFLRLLGGADMPSEGKILRTGRISPPMGLTPGLQSSLTGSENARFAGRIYGLQRDEIAELIEYVRELADIGKYFDMPIGTYSAGMRQRVAFAINMSMNFDYYLFDEIGAGGDKEFRKTAAEMVRRRLRTSKFIIASHRSDELLGICDAGIVIQNGNLTFYDDIKDALAAYGGEDEESERSSRRARRQASKAGAVQGANLSAAPGAAGTTADDSEDRKAIREQRRLKRMLAKQQDRPAGAVAASEPATAEAESPEDREARRMQRRLKRMLEKQQNRPVDAVAVEPGSAAAEAAPSEAEEDREARRMRRRLKRMLEKQQNRPVEADAPPEPATSGVQPSEAIDDREARRERRRLRLLLKSQQHIPVEAASAPELTATEAKPVEANVDREARREQRRQKRLMRSMKAASAGDTAAEREADRSEVLPPAPAIPEPVPVPEVREISFQPPPPPRASEPGTAAIPPVGKAPLARRLPPRPVPDSPQSQSKLTVPPAPPQPAAAPATTATPPFRFSGSKGFLTELACRRQGHAQSTSARAARLLLQHLDDLAGSSRTSSLARAWLVAAAQETAALEAAQAREMLERLVSSDQAGKTAAAPPSSPSPFRSNDTPSAERTAFGLRRAAPKLTNTD